MDAKEIYTQFRAAGLTAEGACGLLGNMQAESGMRANNLQDSYNGIFGLSDEEYTALVDAGSPTYNGKYFAWDGAGYGYCQWTHWRRKKNFFDFAVSKGKSVADGPTQIEFCVKEMREEYSGLFDFLCSTTDMYSAAERVCKEYERPAVNNVNARYGYAQNFYAKVQSGAWDGFGSGTNTPILEPSETPQEAFWPPRMLDYKQGRKNLTGADVLALQAILAARGYECQTTGDFDAKTRLCVMEFQAESGLVGDGVCGNATWTKLLNRK